MHPVIMGRADPGRVPRRHVHQRRDAAPFHPRPSRRRRAELDDLHRPELQARPCRRGARELRRHRALRRRAISGWRPTIAGPTRITRRWTMRRSSAGRRRCGDGYLVATGFNAWGITNGTAAAILLADLIAGPRQSLARAVRRDPDQADRRRQRNSSQGNAAIASHLVGGYLPRKPQELRRAGAGRGGDAQDRRRTMSPPSATNGARSTPSPRSAPIWAAWSAGTRPTGAGIARATARASRSTAASSTAPRSSRSRSRRRR